jgi:hypothetical protein
MAKVVGALVGLLAAALYALAAAQILRGEAVVDLLTPLTARLPVDVAAWIDRAPFIATAAPGWRPIVLAIAAGAGGFGGLLLIVGSRVSATLLWLAFMLVLGVLVGQDLLLAHGLSIEQGLAALDRPHLVALGLALGLSLFVAGAAHIATAPAEEKVDDLLDLGLYERAQHVRDLLRASLDAPATAAPMSARVSMSPVAAPAPAPTPAPLAAPSGSAPALAAPAQHQPAGAPPAAVARQAAWRPPSSAPQAAAPAAAPHAAAVSEGGRDIPGRRPEAAASPPRASMPERRMEAPIPERRLDIPEGRPESVASAPRPSAPERRADGPTVRRPVLEEPFTPVHRSQPRPPSEPRPPNARPGAIIDIPPPKRVDDLERDLQAPLRREEGQAPATERKAPETQRVRDDDKI